MCLLSTTARVYLFSVLCAALADWLMSVRRASPGTCYMFAVCISLCYLDIVVRHCYERLPQDSMCVCVYSCSTPMHGSRLPACMDVTVSPTASGSGKVDLCC